MNNFVNLSSPIRQEQLNQIYNVVRRGRDLTVRFNGIAHRFKFYFQRDEEFRSSKEYIALLEAVSSLGFFVHGFNRMLSQEKKPGWNYVESQFLHIRKATQELKDILTGLSFLTQKLSTIEQVNFNKEICAAFNKTDSYLLLIDNHFQYLNSLAA